MAKITGTAGADILVGTDGNDIIDGLAGIDDMTGGLGHDKYYVDDVLDTINENSGEGTDTVYSTVDYTLPDNVENLILLGAAEFGIGNDWDNTITGTRGNNTLSGGDGSDTMIGGAGDDFYVINQFDLSGINDGDVGEDVIIDRAGRHDKVFSAAAGLDDLIYILQKGLEEAEFQMPGTNVTLTGNTGKNTLTTSDGDDTLDGAKGADTMDGGDGANVFMVDNARDFIIDIFDDVDMDGKPDDATADTAIISVSRYVLDPLAAVEIITLDSTRGIRFTGSDTNNQIFGSVGRDTIHGGGGDDEIHGGGGKDRLYGDLGADTFYFDPDTAFTDPVTIMDFNVAQGDALDITDILSGFDDGTIVEAFVRITDKGRNSIVEVNANGDGNPDNFIQIATIWGVNGLTGEFALVNDGNLIMIHT